MEINLNKLTIPFHEKDIEWRVQQSGLGTGPWAIVLAYVDARAVQERLDEVCGMSNWKDEYVHLPNGVMCRLSIRIDGEWITKENGAPETDVESFKGGISKALVRAASTWGIGRYLYKLEQNFATFHDKNTPHVKFLKINGQNYYWTPPKLPNWALPEEERTTKSNLGAQPKIIMNDIKDEQKAGLKTLLKPTLVDAHKSSMPTVFKPEKEEYVVNFGKKHMGKKLSEMAYNEIAGYIKWLEDSAKKDNKSIGGLAKKFIEEGKKYLESKEGKIPY